MTALEIQYQYLDAATHYLDGHDATFLGGPAIASMLLERWRAALLGLSLDPLSMASTIDWVAKWRLLSAFADRHQLRPSDPRLQAIDLQYHDLRPERSLARRAGLETIIDPDSALSACTNPPEHTRAWFRGTALSRFPSEVVTANWDSVVFDIGEDPLRRVPMMDPMRGTKASTEDIFARSQSARQLLDLLGQ
jgi:proteasome accessory factor A